MGIEPNLKGKVVAVVGATSGIGRASAELSAARAVLFAAAQGGEAVPNEIVMQPESHQL